MDKSKNKIANAFLIMLEGQKEYEITNNDIIKQAGVSKGTFYNNFQGREEIATYIFSSIDDQIIVGLEKINLYISQITSLEVLIQCFSDIVIPSIYQQRERVKILYKGSLAGEWQSYLENRYIHFLCAANHNIDANDFRLRLLAKYTLSIISIWITSPIPTPPEQFQPEFITLFKVKMKDLLN